MILPYTEYQAIAANISPNGQAFTDGKFCDAAAGKKFKTTNPMLKPSARNKKITIEK